MAAQLGLVGTDCHRAQSSAGHTNGIAGAVVTKGRRSVSGVDRQRANGRRVGSDILSEGHVAVRRCKGRVAVEHHVVVHANVVPALDRHRGDTDRLARARESHVITRGNVVAGGNIQDIAGVAAGGQIHVAVNRLNGVVDVEAILGGERDTRALHAALPIGNSQIAECRADDNVAVVRPGGVGHHRAVHDQRVGLDDADVPPRAVVHGNGLNAGLESGSDGTRTVDIERADTGHSIDSHNGPSRIRIDIGVRVATIDNTAAGRVDRHRGTGVRSQKTAQRDVFVCLQVDRAATRVEQRTVGHRDLATAKSVSVSGHRNAPVRAGNVAVSVAGHIIVRSQRDAAVRA